MEIETMGRVTVEATIENWGDLQDLERGLIAPTTVRSLRLQAVVDPETVFLSLPTSLYRQVGIVAGFPTQVTILGRSAAMEVKQVSDDSSTTIGHTVLTQLDLVIDRKQGTLSGNPAHGGDWMYESY